MKLMFHPLFHPLATPTIKTALKEPQKNKDTCEKLSIV